MSHYRNLISLGAVLAALGAIFFSSKGVIIKLAYDGGMTTIEVMVYRMLFSVPIFATSALFLLRAKRVNMGRKDWLLLLLCGFMSYYLATWLSFHGLHYISVQLERLILFTYPAFVVIGMALLQKRLPSRTTVLAACLTYAGIVVVFWRELNLNSLTSDGADQSALWFGTFLVTCSALSYAASVILAKPLITKVGSVFFTGFSMSVSCLAILIHAFSVGALEPERMQAILTEDNLTLMLLIGILGTVIPAYMLNEAIAKIGSEQTAVIGTIGPVATSVLAVIVLNELFTPYHAAALVLSGLGIGLISYRKRT